MIGTVLIVDDVSSNRIVFKARLGAAGYRTVMAADGETGLRLIRAERPDIVVLDYAMDGALQLVTALRAQPQTRVLPIVVVSAEDSATARVAALKAGADDFLGKPVDDQTLLARFRNLLRAQVESGEADLTGLSEAPAGFDGPAIIAHVTNRADTAEQLRSGMARVSRDHLVHVSGDRVYDQNLRPDVYLIDADLTGPGSGLRVMSELLSHPATRHAACLIHYDRIPPFAAAMAYDLGAHDLADDSMGAEELALRIARLARHKRAGDQARARVQDGLRLAMHDPLTGLHNRRYAMAQLQAMAHKADPRRGAIAVMLLDLDRFKSVNDRFGHAAGDAVLIEVARRLAQTLGPNDLLARVGGEEFLVALPEASLDRATDVAVRLCDAIKALPVALPSAPEIRVTASIGVAMAQPGEKLCRPEVLRAMIDRADAALLAAKNAGRDKVTVGRNAAPSLSGWI